MKLLSCHDGKLLTLDTQALAAAHPEKIFRTGLHALDALMPGGKLSRSAVHEILSPPRQAAPLFFALLLAKSAAGSGALIWCDPEKKIYPPALAAQGISLERLYLLHVKNEEVIWATCESLRCRGVGAVVAAPPRLTRIEARRLQLSAERGGGVGLLLRPFRSASTPYAAATRWLVESAPGERTIQRWKIELIHGHGGRVGQTVILEHRRETNFVHTFEELGDRSGEKEVGGARVSA